MIQNIEVGKVIKIFLGSKLRLIRSLLRCLIMSK